MKISIIVEGPSDEIILGGQRDWLASLGLEISVHSTGGRASMLRKARQYYKMARYADSDMVIFLPDQDTDVCAMSTRDKIDVDELSGAVTVVLKRELEAWVLADGECVEASVGLSYSPAGQTDTELDCKTKLQNLIKRKKGYLPTTMQVARMVAEDFSISRAARNNTSAKRFKDLVESI